MSDASLVCSHSLKALSVASLRFSAASRFFWITALARCLVQNSSHSRGKEGTISGSSHSRGGGGYLVNKMDYILCLVVSNGHSKVSVHLEMPYQVVSMRGERWWAVAG